MVPKRIIEFDVIFQRDIFPEPNWPLFLMFDLPFYGSIPPKQGLQNLKNAKTTVGGIYVVNPTKVPTG